MSYYAMHIFQLRMRNILDGLQGLSIEAKLALLAVIVTVATPVALFLADQHREAARTELEVQSLLREVWLLQGGGIGVVNLPETPRSASDEGLAKAETLLLQAFTLSPENPMVHQRFCILYAMVGKTVRAKESCHQALELEPDSWQTYEALAYAYKLEKKFRRALFCYSRALEINPLSFCALINRSRLVASMPDGQVEGSDVARSVLDVELAATLDQWEQYAEVGEFDILRADLFLKMYQYQPSETLLDNALVYAGKAMRHENSNRCARCLRAHALLLKGRFVEAATEVQLALQEQPEDKDGRFVLARIHAYQGKFRQATTGFTELLAESPDFSPAIFYRGLSQLGLFRYELIEDARVAAIRDFTKLAKINLDNSKALFWLGYAEFMGRNYSNSIRFFSSAIEKDPTYASAYYYRGAAYARQGRFYLAGKDCATIGELVAYGLNDCRFFGLLLKEGVLPSNRNSHGELGSRSNPVRVSGSSGQQKYLENLGCQSGAPIKVTSRASLSDRIPTDVFKVACPGDMKKQIHINLYHWGYQETRFVDGFIGKRSLFPPSCCLAIKNKKPLLDLK